MANSVDLDQKSLIWVYNVCQNLPVGKHRIITVTPKTGIGRGLLLAFILSYDAVYHQNA